MAHALDKLNLLIGSQAGNGRLENSPQVDLVDRNEGVVIHVGEEAHDELAIHAVGDAAVAGDRVAKVLDLEGALETRGKETTEWGNQGRKRGQDESMELHGSKGDGPVGLLREEEQLGEVVGFGEENGVGVTLKASKNVGTEVLKWSVEPLKLQCKTHVDRADEVFGSRHDVDKKNTKKDRRNPSPNETLHRLLGRELNELGAAKSNAADVSKDIIRNDQRGGQEEPDHALKDVVHNKVCLYHNQIERHMSPGEVGELELVVAGLQGGNETDEA